MASNELAGKPEQINQVPVYKFLTLSQTISEEEFSYDNFDPLGTVP